MKFSVERAPNSEATVTVELEWTELEKASDRAYRKLAQRYNVPGFRRGHAPRSMLERMLGKDAIYQEGLEELIEDSYREALRSNNLVPIASPTVDAGPLQLNQPYTYTAHVPVLSPVTLGDYHAVRVERPGVDVTDEDVEKVLRDLQQQQTMWLPAERPAQVGDKVVADLKLTVGERQISDLHDNEFELAETREGIFSGMDEHIVGMSEGDTKEFTSTIPSDYPNSDLADQEAHYSVTLKGVKYRELPEIDDELAKSSGDYQTLDELRAAIREQLQARRESNAERDFREALIKAIVDQAEVEIHPTLVEDEAGIMVREMQRLLEQNGLEWSQFLASSGKSEDEYKQDIQPEARDRVKRDLVLDAIADEEGVAVSDQEVQQFLDLLGAMGGSAPMRLRQLTPGQRQNVVSRIRRDKVTALLTTAAGGEEHVHVHGDEEHIHRHDEEEVASGAALAAREGAKLATQAPASRDQSSPAAAGNGKQVSEDESAPVEGEETARQAEGETSVEAAETDIALASERNPDQSPLADDH